MDRPDGMPPWWTPWARLSTARRVARVAAIVFFTWHVAAMLAMGASPAIRKVLSPVFSIYGGKLRMTNTWGMFSKRPSSTHVRIEAVDSRGQVHLLSTTEAGHKGPLERFRDARLRKIQAKLGSTKDRARFGAQYLDGWCRVEGKKIRGVREIRAMQVVHELRDDRNRRTRSAHTKVVLRRTCGGLRPRTLQVVDEDEAGDDGDDP